MANSITSALNSTMRLSGLSSGLDIDSIVQQLMKIEQAKVDKATQSKTLLEWKRDDYRTIINSIRSFKDEFFDNLKPATNIKSASAFQALKVTYGDADSSSYFTATPGSGAAAGTFSIKNVQLAQSAKAESGSVTGSMTGANIDFGTTTISAANNNNKINVTFNGVTKEITLDDGLNNIASLTANLNEKLEDAFGTEKIDAVAVGNGISFTTSNTNVLKIGGVKDNAGLSAIGFSDANKSNKLNLSTKLSDMATAGTGDIFKFSVNGKEFEFSSSQTIGDVVSAVNGDSGVGVKMSYDQLNDRFVVQSKSVGDISGVKIDDISDSGNLMTRLGLSGADEHGTDASITYKDSFGEQTITRSSNDFTINGIAISLKKEYTGDYIDVKLEGDSGKTLELVKSFVGKYNELLDKINTELTEKKYTDYFPLTNEQKADMEKKDIELWEEKAKSGLLKSDSILSGFSSKMRDMLYKEVDGVSKKLYTIGITTGTWDQKGKLVIDEDKLKEAINNSPDEVISLFTKESSTAYSPNMSAAERSSRDSENGIASRLLDVMQDYIRTNRNTEGQKGILLEKAGIIGDFTENNNMLSKEIQSREAIISTLLDKLIDKESQYYARFTAMETALSRMNSQSSWMSQQGS